MNVFVTFDIVVVVCVKQIENSPISGIARYRLMSLLSFPFISGVLGKLI